MLKTTREAMQLQKHLARNALADDKAWLAIDPTLLLALLHDADLAAQLAQGEPRPDDDAICGQLEPKP